VILADDADRIAYLELLRQYSELYRLSLLGYCLMSNHVHLIVVPRTWAPRKGGRPKKPPADSRQDGFAFVA
jgi:REP element-mobilizing transposase RayT